jgi:hypothetical protein
MQAKASSRTNEDRRQAGAWKQQNKVSRSRGRQAARREGEACRKERRKRKKTSQPSGLGWDLGSCQPGLKPRSEH